MAVGVPNSISVPSTAPVDLLSLSMFLTVFANQLQNWIAAASVILNSTGGFSFSVNSHGQLVVTSPKGTVTIVGQN